MNKTEFFKTHGNRLIKTGNDRPEFGDFLFLYPEENELVEKLIADGKKAYSVSETEDGEDYVETTCINDLGYSPFKYGYFVTIS